MRSCDKTPQSILNDPSYQERRSLVEAGLSFQLLVWCFVNGVQQVAISPFQDLQAAYDWMRARALEPGFVRAKLYHVEWTRKELWYQKAPPMPGLSEALLAQARKVINQCHDPYAQGLALTLLGMDDNDFRWAAVCGHPACEEVFFVRIGTDLHWSRESIRCSLHETHKGRYF